MLVGKAIKFNPSESIPKGRVARKIPMGALTEFQRKINGFENSEYYSGPKFRNGDTIVAKITPCLENGKTAFVDILDQEEIAFGSSEFIVLRHTEFTDSEFIYYFARSPLFRDRAISCMEGTSGRKRVNENTLKNLEFEFPDLPSQKSIVKVLSALDAKIALNNRINAELEATAKLIYDYWFVQFDFPNEQNKPYKSSGGKMVWNEELKREIPEGWVNGAMEDLGDIIGGSTPSRKDVSFFTNEGIPWITPNDLSKNKGKKFISKGEFDITDSGLRNASLKRLPKNTILLTSRAPVGYLAIARNELTTNQGFKSFVPNKGYPPAIVYYTVKNSLSFIIQNASGSTFQEISASVLRKLKAILPDKQIATRFEKIVDPIFNKQNTLELENQHLTSLRDWLLPMLMNGKVRVREDIEIAPAMAAEDGGRYGV